MHFQQGDVFDCCMCLKYSSFIGVGERFSMVENVYVHPVHRDSLDEKDWK